MSILNWGPVSRTRRNHALEHATLQVLARKYPSTSLAGYSDAGGFWVVGEVSTEDALHAAQEAIQRLTHGEAGLAIHPHCGTNVAIAGLLGGTLAWLGLSVGHPARGWRAKAENWPLAITLATLGVLIANPLGPILQARVTTDAALDGLHLTGIEATTLGPLVLHHIVTTFAPGPSPTPSKHGAGRGRGD